jgi:dTDP-4-dehydrorhamnose 3,5-epimerase
MKFTPLDLAGAYRIELNPTGDERGFFARSWSAQEFEDRGLNATLVQCSVSFNRQRGTLRGLHFQIAPHEEAKLIRCTRGAIFDVIVDLRLTSPTFGQWRAAELNALNHVSVYAPEGFAHGFQALEDDTEVLYQISAAYTPEAVRGVRWDDPSLSIRWPIKHTILSERDNSLPLLKLEPC